MEYLDSVSNDMISDRKSTVPKANKKPKQSLMKGKLLLGDMSDFEKEGRRRKNKIKKQREGGTQITLLFDIH